MAPSGKLVMSHLLESTPSITDCGNSNGLAWVPPGLVTCVTGIGCPLTSYRIISASDSSDESGYRTLVKVN